MRSAGLTSLGDAGTAETDGERAILPNGDVSPSAVLVRTASTSHRARFESGSEPGGNARVMPSNPQARSL